MKYYLFIYCFVFLSCSLFAQMSKEETIQWQKGMGDKWFNEHVDAMLKVGDKMPDLPLGTVSNNYTGKTKFSDFKGKLVILDFWGSTCSSCIAAFPHMEKLQKEFGDKIQVFLVNVWETQEQINGSFKKIYRNRRIPTMPNLPSILGPRKDLQILFPTRGVPHHVWIDGNSIVRMTGPNINTHEEKIRDLLAGKKISYLKDNCNTPYFNDKIPYCQLMGKSIKPGEYNSFFFPFNGDYAQWGQGAVALNIADSANHTIRNTIVNQEVVELYRIVFEKTLKKNLVNMLYSNHSNAVFLDYFMFLVKDTLKYTAGFKYNYTDKDFLKSRVLSYEQITPMSMPEEERRQKMLADFNQYFEKLYGMKGDMEKRKISCYVIVRTSNKDQLSSDKEKRDGYFIQNEKKMFSVHDYSLSGMLEYCLGDLFRQNHLSQPLFILDETGFDKKKKINIVLPSRDELGTIEDLRNALKPYDLDIIKAEREMNFVAIREQGVKG